MDPSNPFANLPPPMWGDNANSPQLQTSYDEPSPNDNQSNSHATPGGPAPSNSANNPFFQDQQAAIQNFKEKQAQEEQLQQSAMQAQAQPLHQQQQSYTQQQQQQQQYAAQQAMQQQYYQMQNMHNHMAQQQSMHNIMAQQQSAMQIMANQGSFYNKGQMSPQQNAMQIMANQGSFYKQQMPVSPVYNQPNTMSASAYYQQNSNKTLSPKTQQIRNNSFMQFQKNLDQKDSSVPEKKTSEKIEQKKSPEQIAADKEGKRQRNRVRAVNELISTETTYVGKLELLNELYITPMQKNAKLLKKPNHHSVLFPVVLQTILALNQKLLVSMEKNKEQIGKALLDFIPYLKMYQMYMNNHEKAGRMIKQYRSDKSSEFTKYLVAKELEQSGFTLESYLILPIQRMPRYELCLKEIIKLTKDGHSDKDNLNKCYEKVSAVNKQINVRLKDYETRQKVHDIELRIINLEINKEMGVKKSSMNIFQKAKRRNSTDLSVERTRLVQPSRIFMKEGHLTKVSRKKDIKYFFILFNDLLIYCSETVNDKLILHQKINITDEFFRIESAVIIDDDIDYADISNEKDKKKEDKSVRQNTFEIHSIEKSFLCYAANGDEREDWIESIERCVDNAKKSGIAQKKVKSNLEVNTGAEIGRVHSAPVSTGSSRFDKMMMAATAPSAVEAAEAEGRILETAPMWVPNDWTDECMMPDCHNKFSALLLKKRNHCRYCGKLVCSDCCINTLPHYEPKKRNSGIHVKVCDMCHDKYKVKPLMNPEQLNKAAKGLNKNQSNSNLSHSKSRSKPSSPRKMRPEIEIEDSKDSSDEWSGLYDNMQQIAASGNPNVQSLQNINASGMQNSFIKIQQSMTPVIVPAPASQYSDDSLFGKNKPNLHASQYSNHSYQNKSPRNNGNKGHVWQHSGNKVMPDISPRHNLQNSNYSDAFDVDPMNSPLPDENAHAFKQRANNPKYDEDMGTVSAIFAANDNHINSMDLRSYGLNNNKAAHNAAVSLEAMPSKNKQKKNSFHKVGNAVILDENVEVDDNLSDSDEFAANFSSIVIPDSVKKTKSEEELFGFMPNSPKRAPVSDKSTELDKSNDNVKQLTMFGFTSLQIDRAWELMRTNAKHSSIVPDHGPLFVETMLDYLNKVQKDVSKSKIMSAYQEPNQNGGVFAGIDGNWQF